MFLLCETEKICRTGSIFFFAFLVRCCSIVVLFGAVVLLQSIIASAICFAFSRSVWKGLKVRRERLLPGSADLVMQITEKWQLSSCGMRISATQQVLVKLRGLALTWFVQATQYSASR